MALQELRHTFNRSLWRDCRQCSRIQRIDARRCASSSATLELDDLEQTSSEALEIPEDVIKSFDPAGAAKRRKKQLPSSRYQFRSPRHYRGPLHPHQPLPASDPSSRNFIPGPFSLSRMEQTYKSTIAQDLMTLTYAHEPPGTKRGPIGERLRTWEGDSPYFKGRPLRAPKGGHDLRPVHRPITFRNIPQLERITVHSMSSAAGSGDSSYLHVSGMVIQAITNARVTTHESKTNVIQWGLKKGKYVAVTAELRGEDMYHFLAKCVDLVMPKLKDWRGVRATTGDGTGNLTFGFDKEAVALFPEVEVNYDMYPPKMIPGCHVTVHTSATTDKEAKLLLGAIGLPFDGKLA